MTGPMPPDLSPDIHVCMAGTITTTSPLTITRYVEKGLRPTNVSEGLAKFPNHLVRIGENRFERRPMLPGDHLKGVLRDAAFWTVYDAIEDVHDGDVLTRE